MQTSQPSSHPNKHRTLWRDLLWLALGLTICYLIGQGLRPIAVPDGGRYTEIPREMLALKSFLIPHLNYVIYLEKPPLMYWLQAATIALFGTDQVFFLRLPVALLGVVGCLMTFASVNFLFDRRTAWLSCCILASSLLYFLMAHLITTDMLLSTCMSACLLALICALQLPPQDKRRRYLFYAAYVASGLAVMTKGLIGLLLPGLVALIWMLRYWRWQELRHAYLISGTLLFLLVAAPWHLWVAYKIPEFTQFYFFDQQFSRYLTMAAKRYQPSYFFVPVLILGVFPWVGFSIAGLLASFRRNIPEKQRVIHGFFFYWAVGMFAFFSLSHSKLIPYVLPLMLPLAVLTAVFISQRWDKLATQRSIQISAWVTVIMAFIAAIAIGIIPHRFPLPDPVQGRINLWILQTGLLGLSAVTCFFLLRQQLRQVIYTHIIGGLLLLIVTLSLLAAIRNFSILPLAHAAEPWLASSNRIVTFGDYYQDLPVYLKRKITITNWWNELAFGQSLDPHTNDWLWQEPTFFAHWRSPEHLLVFTNLNAYQYLKQQGLSGQHIIAVDKDHILLSNYERPS